MERNSISSPEDNPLPPSYSCDSCWEEESFFRRCFLFDVVFDERSTWNQGTGQKRRTEEKDTSDINV